MYMFIGAFRAGKMPAVAGNRADDSVQPQQKNRVLQRQNNELREATVFHETGKNAGFCAQTVD